MKIDSYTHFACPAFMAHLEAESGHPMVFRGLFSAIPELLDIDLRIRYMDEHGIDVHCLVPLPWLECEPALHADATKALEACRIANDEMAKVVARYPDRLIGVALIPTTTEEIMVQETTRAVEELGMAGLKVISHHHGAMVPFFTARFDTQRRNFHEDEGDDLLADLRLFYCDTATFGESAANVQQAIDFFGQERVLFGTDTPMDMGTRGMFTKTTIASVEALDATAADKDALYSGNVLKMLGERFAGLAGQRRTGPVLASSGEHRKAANL